jgi:hypothetical protein
MTITPTAQQAAEGNALHCTAPNWTVQSSQDGNTCSTSPDIPWTSRSPIRHTQSDTSPPSLQQPPTGPYSETNEPVTLLHRTLRYTCWRRAGGKVNCDCQLHRACVFVYVCMYVCMCVCTYVCMYICMCMYALCVCMRMYVCMYTRMYVCMYARMYVYTYVCMYVCIYVCTYVCMYVYTYVCMYVCIYVCTYVCMYDCIHVCMYVCR